MHKTKLNNWPSVTTNKQQRRRSGGGGGEQSPHENIGKILAIISFPPPPNNFDNLKKKIIICNSRIGFKKHCQALQNHSISNIKNITKHTQLSILRRGERAKFYNVFRRKFWNFPYSPPPPPPSIRKMDRHPW